MTTDEGGADASTLSPDEAFGLLGNDTRVEILRTLGAADGPLAFSELHDRVGLRDSGQFNYHLDRLTGHFVGRTDEGYALRQAGRRVIEAVLSGAVTDAPEGELTRTDWACHYCGAPIAVQYREERVRIYCTGCEGTYGDASRAGGPEVPPEYGYLGSLLLPPAGVEGRTPGEMVRAAWTWGNLEAMAMASGLCPRCSAAIEHDVRVCEDHDATDGLCERCDNRRAIGVSADCTNCNYGHWGGAMLRLGAETALLSFLLEHGINPVAPTAAGRERVDRVHQDYGEELLGTDPFEARFTFRIGDDELAVTVDDELRVVDVTRTRA
jgi:DNA-binding transcriptional ArsR family regulator